MDFPASPSPSVSAARPLRLLRPWPLVLALWLALAAAASLGLWQLRRDALDSRARELDMLSLALADEMDRGLRGAQEGLAATGEEWAAGRLPLAGPQARAALGTRADLMPLVRSLWLVGPGGRVEAASDDTPAPDLRAFAPPLQGLREGAAAISRRFGGARGGPSLVALAVPAPAGRGGWVIAAMPASALLGAFGVALPEAGAGMVVLRGDGERLVGAGTEPPWPGQARPAPDRTVRPGLQVRRAPDGRSHLVASRRLPRYGIDVRLSRDLAMLLASWRQAAQVTAAALALLLLGLAAAGHFVQRAEHRRALAQRALQAQLARSSKLESLGTLAGGVAHDFNNVLAGILGYGEMARDAAAPGSAQARHLDKVVQAALRGKALVERILAFSRGGARSSAVFELEPVVEEVLNLLAGSLRHGVVLERAFDAPGGRLRGDATQVFEAAMNLCTNAMQAMPAGGMLSVRLRRERVAAARVLTHSALAAGDYLVLEVQDQGEGISDRAMDHLFEPFFTTKAAQSGTGLGLAVVHGVVAGFDGAIDVASRPGQGARFTLYFPECGDAAPAGAVPGAVPPQGGGTGQRLLVVDDDPALVALALEMLEGLGYEPQGHAEAAAALQALREDPGRFAAVITDEAMPGLTGTRFTEALRRFAPDLPVLLVSGYGGASLARRAAEAGVTRVLAKPLRRADLAQALAELLR